jgi:3-hydroxyacyl-CoA dehydrogenase
VIDAVKNVVILGASGTVGSLTGGIIAQQGLKTYFLSRTLDGAKKGLAKAMKQARSEVISRHIECGSYDHSLESALSEADLIIESITEDVQAKQHIYKLIERYRRDDTIVGTTTSSLPLDILIEGRSDGFKKHFLSTHFYNPPGKMLACEITGTEYTDNDVYEFMKEFLEKDLERVIIPVKNMPGFAGNRIAFVLFNKVTALAEEYGVELLDYLIGPYTGRLMPPLATIDLVGLNIHKAIVRSLQNYTNDQMHDTLVMPDYIKRMIESGFLGRKTKAGFYKRLENDQNIYFDPQTDEYIPAIDPHIGFVEKAKAQIHLGKYDLAFDVIKNARGSEAEIVMDILCMYVAYSYSLIGDVCVAEDGINGIDKVMAYGFNWAPPSVIMTILGGPEEVSEMLDKRGFIVPDSLKDPVVENTDFNKINSGKFFVAR